MSLSLIKPVKTTSHIFLQKAQCSKQIDFNGVTHAYQTQEQKSFIQPHIIQSQFSHTFSSKIMGQEDPIKTILCRWSIIMLLPGLVVYNAV